MTLRSFQRVTAVVLIGAAVGVAALPGGRTGE
jgi:hypothetical protein